jgi:hypothetical protein
MRGRCHPGDNVRRTSIPERATAQRWLRVASARLGTSYARSQQPGRRKPQSPPKACRPPREDSLAALGTFSGLCHRSDAPKGEVGPNRNNQLKPTLHSLCQGQYRESAASVEAKYIAWFVRARQLRKGVRNLSKSAIMSLSCFFKPGEKTMCGFMSVLTVSELQHGGHRCAARTAAECNSTCALAQAAYFPGIAPRSHAWSQSFRVSGSS